MANTKTATNDKKVLEIFVREKEMKDKETGKTIKKFNTYSVKQKDGKFMQCKFTKEAGYPKFQSRGTIEVFKEDMNISETGLYPCLWIKAFENEKEYERDTSKIDELF